MMGRLWHHGAHAPAQHQGTNFKSNARGRVFIKGRGEWHYPHGDRCFQWIFGTCPGLEEWKEVEEYSSGANGINKCLEVGERQVYVKLPTRNTSKQRTERGDGTHPPGPMDSQSWYFIHHFMFGLKLLRVWIGKCLWQSKRGCRKKLLNSMWNRILTVKGKALKFRPQEPPKGDPWWLESKDSHSQQQKSFLFGWQVWHWDELPIARGKYAVRDGVRKLLHCTGS